MNVRPLLAAVGLGLGIVLIGFLMWDRRPVHLIALPDAPRTPVAADPAAPKPSLVGLRTTTSRHNTGDAARRERNRIASAWIEGLEGLESGRSDQGQVERLEMELWVQRLHTGEVQAQEVHAALAALFERELERRKLLLAKGFASENDVREAQVLLARERFAAGMASSGYATQRATYLEARRKHLMLLAENNLMVRDVAIVEIEALEAELPAPETLRPAKSKT